MVEPTHTSGRWPGLFEPWRTAAAKVADWFAPASEASDQGDKYEICVELPGVAPEDIDVSVNDGILTLKGEKLTSREEKDGSYFFSERQYGAFSRSFRLPPDGAENKLSADMKDGVLTISVPRIAQKEPESKKVKITQS
jgi:HSP20 family protein